MLKRWSCIVCTLFKMSKIRKPEIKKIGVPFLISFIFFKNVSSSKSHKKNYVTPGFRDSVIPGF